jgi:hypothetical protein
MFGLLALVAIIVAAILLTGIFISIVTLHLGARTSSGFPFAVGLGIGILLLFSAFASSSVNIGQEHRPLFLVGALLVIANAIALIALPLRPRLLWKPIAPLQDRRADLDARLQREDEVERLLRQGKKIQAIRVYRQDTGATLSEAKGAVEARATELGIEVRSQPVGTRLVVLGFAGLAFLLVISLLLLLR